MPAASPTPSTGDTCAAAARDNTRAARAVPRAGPAPIGRRPPNQTAAPSNHIFALARRPGKRRWNSATLACFAARTAFCATLNLLLLRAAAAACLPTHLAARTGCQRGENRTHDTQRLVRLVNYSRTSRRGEYCVSECSRCEWAWLARKKLARSHLNMSLCVVDAHANRATTSAAEKQVRLAAGFWRNVN